MDYEKKYKDALERAREWYNNPNSSSIGKAYLYAVFPELKENEDERIRKALLKHFGKSGAQFWFDRNIKYRDVLHWLEKQGEQKQEESTLKCVPFRIKKGEWYVCIHDFCNKAIRIGEIIQAEHDDTIRGFGFLYMENKYFRPAFGNEIPQKPKWTEEDESKVNEIVYFLDTAKVHYASTTALDDCIEWLKSLKQRNL